MPPRLTPLPKRDGRDSCVALTVDLSKLSRLHNAAERLHVQGCDDRGDLYAEEMSRGDSTGQFELAGERFSWSVKYYGGESSANTHVRGLSARVTLAAGQTRELVIEFDPEEYTAKRPASIQQLAARIEEVTALAIEDGFKPDSRGKPYRFTAERSGA